MISAVLAVEAQILQREDVTGKEGSPLGTAQRKMCQVESGQYARSRNENRLLGD